MNQKHRQAAEYAAKEKAADESFYDNLSQQEKDQMLWNIAWEDGRKTGYQEGLKAAQLKMAELIATMQSLAEIREFVYPIVDKAEQETKAAQAGRKAYEDERSKPIKDDWPKKVVQPEIPLDIEQAASKWADSQYPDDTNANEWLAARNGYRQCWRDMQTPKDDWKGLQGTNTD